VNLLYFWRGDNYQRDLDHGVGFHLNQANALLHQIRIGDSLVRSHESSMVDSYSAHQ
jgi:5-methylcytosine-specific restriction enzyme A